jgi:glyoxylase-like metal-dependent hydrolase (beta-lactamase superfamily II)
MLVVRIAVVGPLAANCYLVGSSQTQDAIVIDPGGEQRRVLEMRDPGGFRVTRIFCTHGHIDHVAGGAEMQAETRAPLQLHPDDATWLERVPAQAAMFGFDDVRAPTVDHWHADGETFGIGGYEARVIHTPGHTRGSCSLYVPEAKALFTGDTLFCGSVGRTDLPGGDFGALERSIKERLFVLGDEVRFYPGHGPIGLLGEERKSNPFVGESAPRGRFL